MAVNPDPLGWAEIEKKRQRKILYDIADAKGGLAPGTSASNNGEPDLAPAAWSAAAGTTAGPESEAASWLQANGFPAGGAPLTGASSTAGSAGDWGSADANPTAPGAPAPAAAATFDSTLYQTMARYLSDYGLGSLFSVGANGAPSGWLYEQMQNGIDTADEIQLAVESTAAWQERFSVIVEQRKQAALGNPVQVMTPAQVREYEQTTAQLMRTAGLPTYMFDQPKDFGALMLAGVSTQEVQQRLGTAFDRVRNSNSAVRDEFERFFGVGNGDAGLAAYFLDPTKSLASIDRVSREAFAAGTARRYGLTLDRQLAGDITDKGLTDAGIEQGFENINRLSTIFNETAMEASDLSAEREGIASTFGGDGIAQDAIERRVTERKANSARTTGGALITQAGAIGAGRIDR